MLSSAVSFFCIHHLTSTHFFTLITALHYILLFRLVLFQTNLEHFAINKGAIAPSKQQQKHKKTKSGTNIKSSM